MQFHTSLRRAFWLGLLATCLGSGALAATPAAAPATAKALDNTTCLSCHDGKKGKLEVAGTEGGKRALGSVAADAFAKGVHAKMTCVACHSDISDNAEKAKHQKNTAQPLKKVDCAGCHQDLWAKAKQDGTAAQKPRLEVVVKNIEQYKTSFHARPNPDDETKPNASCDNCHDTHSFNVPAAGTPERKTWRLAISNVCGTCHEDQLETYKDSIHGQKVLEEKNPDAAVCSDCHTAHGVVSTSSDPFKRVISDQCGNCHEDKYKTYKATYHGQVGTLGYTNVAKCYNCHGSHDIVKVEDPKSKVNEANRLKTCQSCHGKNGVGPAAAGFVSYQPHGHAGDFKHYPHIWVADQIMTQLLVGTFGFFWLHTLLWFYREYKERKQRSTQPHIKVDETMIKHKGKHVRRFSAIWRVAHLTFALSLMTLTLTGMPLFYPATPWAPVIMNALGGVHTAGIIHRVAAVIFAGVFFWHLIYMVTGIARNWKTFQIFGPNSMVPNLQDGKDMLAMFKWFFGQGPRPKFDRWTYWEKFDYWAPFWGVTIIGVSGLVMWLPGVFASFLPGWIFNVAAIFHAEEAFLAVVFLFTVHFFNNHFRPDKFPLDVVMFTGTFSLEDFKHEHANEYKRLVETGELESRLVDAPSPTKMLLSRILGFVLITCGLSLLTMVAIGFFTSSH